MEGNKVEQLELEIENLKMALAAAEKTAASKPKNNKEWKLRVLNLLEQHGPMSYADLFALCEKHGINITRAQLRGWSGFGIGLGILSFGEDKKLRVIVSGLTAPEIPAAEKVVDTTFTKIETKALPEPKTMFRWRETAKSLLTNGKPWTPLNLRRAVIAKLGKSPGKKAVEQFLYELNRKKVISRVNHGVYMTPAKVEEKPKTWAGVV